MRIIVIGMGVQGNKRYAVAGSDVISTVDPVWPGADFKAIQDVPLESFDAALCCIPDQPKFEIISYLLSNKKHVLIEKPLWVNEEKKIIELEKLAIDNNVQCYTAYNHRFEPHFKTMKSLIKSGDLGEIYRCRLFYGNGTARLVRDSKWRDKGAGVLPDLGSHLLDTIQYWFGYPEGKFRIVSCSSFENNSLDHVVVGCEGSCPKIELEMTFLQWKNHFTCDIFAENGSGHIISLCKWGPSSLIIRKRTFPAGRPSETVETLVDDDPTWELEYEYFCKLCLENKPTDLRKDLWLSKNISNLSQEAMKTS